MILDGNRNTPGWCRMACFALGGNRLLETGCQSRANGGLVSSLHSLAFWPDQEARNHRSLVFTLARKGAMAPMAKGKTGIGSHLCRWGQALS